MTFYSLCLEAWPADCPSSAFSALPASCTVARSLQYAASDWGPYRLVSWAQARNIDVSYIDNCFVRVPVTFQQAAEFVREAGDPKPLSPPGCDIQYVIRAEEY